VIDLIRLVVFDMAGTTVRDSGQVPRAMIAALAEHRIDVTPEQLSRVRGSSKREAIRHFLPEGVDRETLGASAYAAFREHLTQLYRTEGVEPIAHAADLFRSLKARGVRVALNTGFDRAITNLLLDTLQWDDGLADAVVCGDDVRHGRPAPYMIFHSMEATGVTSVQHVANVGDTVLDLQAGHNASVRWNVGVLSGAHDRKRLEEAPHSHVLESIADLPALWR
jgi:phosphonatase-like hydrolase